MFVLRIKRFLELTSNHIKGYLKKISINIVQEHLYTIKIDGYAIQVNGHSIQMDGHIIKVGGDTIKAGGHIKKSSGHSKKIRRTVMS
jgi:cell division protein ZapA (FtsZ GTPase activity inhibitor)